VIRRAAHAFTIMALCCAIGLHWLGLQSIAWATMLIQNSKQASLCQSFSRTFDGAHPCSLCHLVSKGKDSEKKSDVQPINGKVDLVCVPRAILRAPPFVLFCYPTLNSLSFPRNHSPPVPPPRLVSVWS